MEEGCGASRDAKDSELVGVVEQCMCPDEYQ